MHIEKQLESARQRLLDLTFRNRLLNFRPSKRRSIQIIDEIPREIFDILVLNERVMDFKAFETQEENFPHISGEKYIGSTNTDLFQVRQNLLNALYAVMHIKHFDPPKQHILTSKSSSGNTPLNTKTEDDELLPWLRDFDGNKDYTPSLTGRTESTSFITKTEDTAPQQKLQDIEIKHSHTDRLLQTLLSQDELQKRLYYINQQSRSVFEEQGYSVLYLALGFLKWNDGENIEKINRAPLILIPVELERQKDRTKYKLSWSGADLLPNLSLEAKLSEQGISLPSLESLEEKGEIDDFFQNVIDAISTKSNWEVVPDIYLDLFSFTKFVMYKDLEPGVWDINHHPLLELVLSGNEDKVQEEGFKAEETDLKLPSESVYHVMDADSSQIAVIEEVKMGKNLVVEGPPGTGKSQTITNLIAELLADGKKVLFVSEKMAALEVVKSRLDKVGLGNFCLELHSHKSNKREVLQELQRSMSSQLKNYVGETDKYSRVDNLKSVLNGYVKTLHTPIANTEKSPFMLLAIRGKAKNYFTSKKLKMRRIWFPNPSTADLTAWNTAIQKLENLSTIMPSVIPLSAHPWRGCATGTISTQREEEIFDRIADFANSIDNLLKVFSRLEGEFGVCLPKSMSLMKKHLIAAEVVANAIPVEASILLNQKWDTFNDEAKDLIQQVEIISQAKKKFKRWALETDPQLKLDTDLIMKLADEYEDYSYLPSWKRFFNWRYHRDVKNPIRSYFRESMPKDPVQVRADLNELSDCIIMREKIEWIMAATQTGPSLYGNQWDGEDSNPDQLRKFGEWIVKFRGFLREGILTKKAVDIASKGTIDSTLNSIKTELDSAMNNFRLKRESLYKSLGTNSNLLFGIEEDEVFFDDYCSRIELWEKERSKLRTWGKFSSRQEACRNTIAKPLLEYLEELNPEDLVPCFEVNLPESLLQETLPSSPFLNDFVGEEHEYKISEFKRLDSNCIELNRYRLAFKLQEKKPNFFGGASSASEMGILQGQFNKKRGHMSIRKLLSVTGGLVQRIKPCFMMSPLSVAQFCDPQMIQFDVIVFDEASQIRPEDALGALLRAKQAVVIGDTRQLPPTRFFDSIVENSDEEDNDDYIVSIIDVESILHQCRQRFPVKQLKWHYRSRHESLIAISNQEFYQNDLLIFPSPIDKAEHLGLKFVHIPYAIYDRGKTSSNRIEAEIVVNAVFDHFQKYPDKSLGVGTFNMSQQQLILDEVENRLNLYPEMNEFFTRNRDEHFFVKNLETIQGDERDCIFLSIGYGKDKDGKLYKNFGPLNHEGGERRLNVLITRAREKCVVFSNFRAIDLQLDASAPFGVRALKIFLDYAENRNLVVHTSEVTENGSEFEDDVYNFLTNNGNIVKRQVGCAEYKIDLAIVDKDFPNRYIIGIECDGQQYLNAPVARDRDRLRSQVLEGLGWKLHRLWSMDWYQDRDSTEKRILDAIVKATTADEIPITDIDETESVELLPIEIEPDSQPIPEPNSQIIDYAICDNLGILIQGELHLQSPSLLAEAICQVVNVESPVHINLMILRIRTLWGLSKTGAKIKNAIEQGILFAEKNNWIQRNGDFLWSVDDKEITVRKRENPKIEWICDEEITKAMELVLSLQGAITSDALISESVKYFGYKSKGKKIVEKIKPIIYKLIENKVFGLTQHDMVYLLKHHQ